MQERNPFKRKPGKNPSRCRLFVILARDATTGVIIRRGPTRWVQLIKWDIATDAFEPGQWFHGRVYEHRADLSPDGTKLIYFAAKIPGRPQQGDDSFYAWTAISRLPYFTAIALWPSRLGTWLGGGLFVSNTRVQLNQPECGVNAHPDHQAPPTLEVISQPLDPRYEAVFYQRLHRDGWRVDPEWWERYAPSGFVGAPHAWHEKAHPKHAFGLVMESHIFSLDPLTFALQDDRLGELIPLEGATWADWDQRGRLAYAKDGKLFAGEVTERGVGNILELADFNSHRPEPVEAPDWARVW